MEVNRAIVCSAFAIWSIQSIRSIKVLFHVDKSIKGMKHSMCSSVDRSAMNNVVTTMNRD